MEVLPMNNQEVHFISSTPEDVEFVDNKIFEFNKMQVALTQKETPILKNYVIKEHGEIIAGINACVYHWGILYIDVLFVDVAHRGQGFGSRLLIHVENEARLIGATLVHLDTFDFQAKDFYLKHGYEIFGILEDCPPNHKRYYLKKVL